MILPVFLLHLVAAHCLLLSLLLRSVHSYLAANNCSGVKLTLEVGYYILHILHTQTYRMFSTVGVIHSFVDSCIRLMFVCSVRHCPRLSVASFLGGGDAYAKKPL